MDSANIGYLYYKEYYNKYFKEIKTQKDIDDKKGCFEEINKQIEEAGNVNGIRQISIQYDGIQNSFLQTTYPGLLIGSGYEHGIGNDGEFKLGFEFDYTIGLPIINGSSVKGLLRSMFYSENDSLESEKRAYIASIMKELNIKYNDNDYKKVTDEIFEGKSGDKNIAMCDRDVFFEAVIDVERTKKNLENLDEYILGDDYITPHNKKEPTKNPIPVRFLKVMPNVVWRFQFYLKDNYYAGQEKDYSKDKKVNYIINAEDKKRLFEKIILDLGIGAKTNVGYGCLELLDDDGYVSENVSEEKLEELKNFYKNR